MALALVAEREGTMQWKGFHKITDLFLWKILVLVLQLLVDLASDFFTYLESGQTRTISHLTPSNFSILLYMIVAKPFFHSRVKTRPLANSWIIVEHT